MRLMLWGVKITLCRWSNEFGVGGWGEQSWCDWNMHVPVLQQTLRLRKWDLGFSSLMKIKITVLWDVMPCTLLSFTDPSYLFLLSSFLSPFFLFIVYINAVSSSPFYYFRAFISSPFSLILIFPHFFFALSSLSFFIQIFPSQQNSLGKYCLPSVVLSPS
jgi:hypothetical protein